MLNVLYQFNENYVPYAGVSIVSLLENNKAIDDITVFLLTEKVCAESIEKLTAQVEQYGRKAVYINPDGVIEKMKAVGINEYRGSCAANMKMFVADFIPENVERLLYIDADTVVAGDLSEIPTIDMAGNPIAMTQDSVCKSHKQSVGYDKAETYYNSGVILFDIKRWKELQCTERICNHLTTVRSHYMCPDQDVINIVLKGQITELPIRYNIQPMHVAYKYKTYFRFFGQKGYYTEQEVTDALANPGIFHFFRYLGQFPWHKDSLHPDTEIFDEYLAKSLWSDYEKQITNQNDIVFRAERGLYKVLPRSVFIIIFKVCYEFFMWKSNKDSQKHTNNARM